MIIWLRGMSSSGKTTIAKAVKEKYKSSRSTVIIDGDEVRSGLSSGLGHEYDSIIENCRRMAEVCSLIEPQVDIVILACMAPSIASRETIKQVFNKNKVEFVEIFCHADCEVLKKRDTKGIYNSRLGHVYYCTNEDFDIGIDTHELTVDECVNIVSSYI